MKSRFTTFDIKVTICELRNRLIGLRVVNVYDVDSKTYLIKLAKPDDKAVLLLESGIRFHSTDFEWPKNMMPSGFAMKMRKHLKSRRLEKVEQLGADRIVDLQFGSGDAAYHIILELYDRGNIVLTDHEYLILNILRPRTDESQDVHFAVREKYPCDAAKQHHGLPTEEWLTSVLLSSKSGESLRKILNPHLVYGPALIDHCLLSFGLPLNAHVGKEFVLESDMSRLMEAMKLADSIMFTGSETRCKGYIIQQKEKRPVVESEAADSNELLTYVEFHPILFKQFESQQFIECVSFDKAVDEFFSKIESQKMDIKVIQQERTALKKLDNVKKDHIKRLEGLQLDQEIDVRKAQLIEVNLTLVDRAITVIRSALANQIDWAEIQDMVSETAQQGDVVAMAIKTLKLDINHMTLLLKYEPDVDDDSDTENKDEKKSLKAMKVDIDLGLSAYANARKYFDLKRHALTKEQKTISASAKALKSAERKTRQTLKDVHIVASINKARKTYWFEKFFWFISSENYLVIGGRDQQQNEIIVKRYLNPGDIYVHADLHGASSVVVKNSSREEPIPPKTLNEAGTMALCNSAAWDAKVVTSSWWVYHDQVSKTAPTGEYLTTGSFMIRGKKNFLPPSYLVYGFGFLFKIDETSVCRHKNERRVRTVEEEVEPLESSTATPSEAAESKNDDGLGNDNGSDLELAGSSDESSTESEDNDAQSDKHDEPTELSTIVETPEILASDVLVEQKKEAASDNAGTSGVHMFPDTSIQLHHVKRDKFTLQRDSVTPVDSSLGNADEYDDKIYLGDDKPIILGEKVKCSRVSAKQRRELKKGMLHSQVEAEDVSSTGLLKNCLDSSNAKLVKPASAPVHIQLKRGQKSKLKKMKDLYGDQDEEERRIKMELLASAGPPKEVKSKKGAKAMKQHPNKKSLPGQQAVQKNKNPVRPSKEDLVVETPSMDIVAGSASGLEAGDKDGEVVTAASTEQELDDGQQDEQTQDMQVNDILDSLTGQPVSEDILLFCLPVCAPYAALTTYKYKVKLVPGTTKRGKAAKLAVNMFATDKTTTPREKDLFKSLKDTDLSRNMPGKVKVSSNLHKTKRK